MGWRDSKFGELNHKAVMILAQYGKAYDFANLKLSNMLYNVVLYVILLLKDLNSSKPS